MQHDIEHVTGHYARANVRPSTPALPCALCLVQYTMVL